MVRQFLAHFLGCARHLGVALLLAWSSGAATASRAAGFPSPADWRDQNIYFIFTDRFNDGDPSNNNANPQSAYNATDSKRIHGGDFRGIQQKLDYIKALGSTAIWITPIPQNVGDSGYHGYGADNFYQVQPNWGTMTDLSNLVAAAHAQDLRVILDIVCNHAGTRIDSTDSGWATYKDAGYNLRWTTGTAYPAPFNSLSYFHNKGHIQSFTDPQQILGELSGLDDLRTEDAAVRTNLVNIYKEWIRAADFDGFRIDTVKHTDIGLWQYFNGEIRTYAQSLGKTNFFQFGEVYDGSESKCGYYTGTKAGGAFANDAVVDYPLFFTVRPVFAQASGNTKQIEDHYNALAANYDPAAASRLVTFLDNHDQQRFLFSNNANNNTGRLAVALGFLYSSRGIPCLYYGTEQHFNGGSDPNNREDMFDGKFEQGPSLGDNFDQTKGLFQHVARLNNFRRLYPALRQGSHVNLWNNPGGPGLFAYARRLGSEEVVVVFNTASSSQTLPTRATSYAAGTKLVNLFNTNESLTVTADANGLPAITVPGTALKMFVDATLWKPLDPVVRLQSVAHGASNIVATAGLTLTFSKPMQTNATQAAFSVQPPVGGTFTWSVARDALTFTPSPSFAGSTTIVVRVSTNALDSVDSNRLYAAFETFFVTATAAYTDAVPPVLLVQTPVFGSTLTNTVLISGVATDNVAVQRVEVRMDGGNWSPATGTTNWSLALDSRNFLNGTHEVQARALDALGNASTNGAFSVRFFNVPGAYERRLSAGNASTITNCDAVVWPADQVYTLGGYGYAGGTNGYLGNAISGVCATAQSLYQRERYSPPAATLRYLFDVPEGVYETTILEAETWVTAINKRVFDLYIQGQRMLTNFDIFAEAGGMNRPLSRTFTNVVTDAQLELHFIPQVDNARVSGIQVRRIGEVDTDGDGAPDWWMRGWFDHPTGQEADQSRAEDDADQDGFSNAEEYILKTSPLDAQDVPNVRIEGLSLAEAASVTMPTSASGRLYHLEWRAELDGTGTWSVIEANHPGSGLPVILTDPNAPDHGTYRVRITLP